MAHMKGMIIYNMLDGPSNIKPTQEAVTKPLQAVNIAVRKSRLQLTRVENDFIGVYESGFPVACISLRHATRC